MSMGTLYGIGVGPGDPDLITVKAARILASCSHVFVPRPRGVSEGVAWRIASSHVNPEATLHEVVFPMSRDPYELESQWYESTWHIAEVLETGADACYLTLGDSMLYSTYSYMLQALRRRIPALQVVTVPGISSFSAAAALAQFPLGEGRQWVTIVPAAGDLSEVSSAVLQGGTVVLMKIGKRLPMVVDLLEELGVLDTSVFVARAGLEAERVETDLRKLRTDIEEDTGNLSIILIRGRDPRHAGQEGDVA